MRANIAKYRLQLLVGIAEFVLAGVLIVFAAAVSVTAVMKLFDPVHWGLWISPNIVLFGAVDDPAQAAEVLGSNLYPVAALSLILGYMAAKESWYSARLRVASAWQSLTGAKPADTH